MMDFSNSADLEQMKKDPKITAYVSEGLNVAYMAFNTEKPPFDNVKV